MFPDTSNENKSLFYISPCYIVIKIRIRSHFESKFNGKLKTKFRRFNLFVLVWASRAIVPPMVLIVKTVASLLSNQCHGDSIKNV